MGLTNQSTGTSMLTEELKIQLSDSEDKIVALAGNPNVGKSTVFNSLTGLKQHTGNWPGKTVSNAQGRCKHRGKNFIMVDVPGTYSLMANSVEEQVARDFVCFGYPDATIVVTDATCLERNLNLVLQTIEITDKIVVCVNLVDEAKRKKIKINYDKLSNILGVPVIPTIARSDKGLCRLMDSVHNVAHGSADADPIKIIYDDAIEEAIEMVQSKVHNLVQGKISSRWVALKLLDGEPSLLVSLGKHLGFDLLNSTGLTKIIENARNYLFERGIDGEQLRDRIVLKLVSTAEEISKQTVTFGKEEYNNTDRKIDRILTSRTWGIPIMLALLAIVFWLTITGANIPSQMLSSLLFWFEGRLTVFFTWLNMPGFIHSLLIEGVYRTIAWVVSVMLPPMAIFFPLFTLLEDLGYLPRIAFNLDNFFKKACAHGKQALTMCMGFGCNAAGVIGCRIIDSPRERLIAIITNNFVPCNGRFPILISIITMFFAAGIVSPFRSLFSALILIGVIMLGVVMTLFISKILSKTILKGIPSSFTLEMPPYRKPQVGKIIVRSVFDRTLFVLGRAVAIAAPAGIVIWVMANIYIGDITLLTHSAGILDPFAKLIGMDGYILMAFILGFPANEIVVPIIIMSYLSKSSMMEFKTLHELKELLVLNGWNWITAVCVMIFSLMHWPCGTTCWTINKETRSLKWTFASIIIPTATGIIICFIIANLARLLSLI
ncbi:MAG: ferrous iron transport protein B [Clostridium sp.]|nr:ferrous iron transport protein B [Clostridium sp.]